jgi:hypothetical protein
MLRKKAQPHRITRLVILLAAIASVLGVVDSNNLAGVIFAGIFLVRAAYLFAMSLKFGTGGSTPLDRTCLAVAALAMIAYVITGNGWVAITLAILADLIGYIPTFVKTWRQPSSEDPTFFAIEGLASLFGALAVAEWSIGVVLPLYFAACCIVVLALIYRPRLLRAEASLDDLK